MRTKCGLTCEEEEESEEDVEDAGAEEGVEGGADRRERDVARAEHDEQRPEAPRPVVAPQRTAERTAGAQRRRETALLQVSVQQLILIISK